VDIDTDKGVVTQVEGPGEFNSIMQRMNALQERQGAAAATASP